MKLRFFQALIALALLASLEAAARVAYTIQQGPASENKWFVYTADTGWERRPNFSGHDDCGKHREFGRDGFLPADLDRISDSGPGQFRALFLGDSNIYGYCLEAADTLTEAANSLLPGVVSVNLGVPGYSSYQGYRALEKYGDRIKPDIVFISFNYNDRRLVLDPGQADGERTFARVYSATRIQRLAEFSYLFRAAQFAAEKIFPADSADSGRMREVSLDTLRPRVDAASYRQNLTNIVLWARQRGVATAFLLLGDNPDQTYLLREGVALLSAGRLDEAITKLAAARDEEEDHHFSSLARLYLARALDGAKRSNEARQALAVRDLFGGLHGGYPIALDTEYHQVMREVGARFGVPVIDAVAELNRSAGVYFDQCHFDAAGQKMVAGLAVKAIEAAQAKAGNSTR